VPVAYRLKLIENLTQRDLSLRKAGPPIEKGIMKIGIMSSEQPVGSEGEKKLLA